MNQRTLGMIKPDAVRDGNAGKILARIEASGLSLEALRMVRLTIDQAREFYAIHQHQDWFGDLMTFMVSGPVVLMVLGGDQAVDRYRALMGATDPAEAAPNTLRALFAKSKSENAVHGSDLPENAAKEIDFFRRALSPRM